MFNISKILSSEIVDYPLDLFNRYMDPSDPSILHERKTFYKLYVLERYKKCILKLFKEQPGYLFYFVFISLVDDFH